MWWRLATWIPHLASTAAPSTVHGPCWPKRGQQLSTKDLCRHFWGWGLGTWWCLCHSSRSRGRWWSQRRSLRLPTDAPVSAQVYLIWRILALIHLNPIHPSSTAYLELDRRHSSSSRELQTSLPPVTLATSCWGSWGVPKPGWRCTVIPPIWSASKPPPCETWPKKGPPQGDTRQASVIDAQTTTNGSFPCIRAVVLLSLPKMTGLLTLSMPKGDTRQSSEKAAGIWDFF